jgi:hypothetical protein
MSENLPAGKPRAATLSVVSNSLLAGGKLLIGLFAVGGSAQRRLQVPVDMPHKVPR